EDEKIYTKWQKRTKHLHTIAGKINRFNHFIRREKNTWLESSPWKRRATLASWLILMQVKRQLPSVFFSTLDAFIKLEKPMRVLQRWTGWNRSKSAESQSPLQQQPLNGMITGSILSIRLDT